MDRSITTDRPALLSHRAAAGRGRVQRRTSRVRSAADGPRYGKRWARPSTGGELEPKRGRVEPDSGVRRGLYLAVARLLVRYRVSAVEGFFCHLRKVRMYR